LARGTKSARHGRGAVLETVIIVAIALALAVAIQAFVVKPYRIPSQSMEPTLAVGQRVLVNRIGNRLGDPQVGDIVVFHPPEGAEGAAGPQCGVNVAADQICPAPTPQRSRQNFIKRIVAGPGDRLAIRDGRVIRNGRLVSEPYIAPCDGTETCTFRASITIPPGEYFMMGDNRGQSDDSRFWGPVPRSWIIGGAFATYWPPKRIGLL
jgi:signal peptidase I